MNENDEEIINRFVQLIPRFYENVEKSFKEYQSKSDNKSLLKCLVQKYPYLSKTKQLTKRAKIDKIKAPIHELLELEEFSDKFIQKEKDIIYKYCINKICGLYKHAQALKTGYCNLQIISGISEKNTLSICITKNSLEANDQWLRRLFKELDNRYPLFKLNNKIMIISSKKNTLDGNATHCKDINTAWGYLKKINEFKIIFVCSNTTRILDVLEIVEDFQNLQPHLKKNIRIQHDEAHNKNEGIPAHRAIIENIVCNPIVLSYMPITATNKTLCIDTNPLWIETNLENKAVDYTSFDKTKSTDPNYSSCNDAIKINFEELQTKNKWKDFGITCVSEELFKKVHGNMANNVEERRGLEFCQFMKNDNEIEAVNNGMNCLYLNDLLEFKYFQKNIFNLHIISTPRRNIITRLLAEEAIKMNYNPIVLAIYGNEGNKYHLLYSNYEEEVSNIMNNGEFNEKLAKLINYLKSKSIDINRPFIIMGNYMPTGESLSYVNYKYGTIRGNVRLISTNAEEDYQEACRENYMVTKFIENKPTWTKPDKYLIGPKQYIENAMSYEIENDARIDFILSCRESNTINDTILPSISQLLEDSGGIVAIPIKITVDRSDPKIIEMDIIINKSRKDSNDKKIFLELLKECCDNDEIDCDIEDASGKFNFETFSINEFRTYRKKDNGPKNGEWKFKSYQNHFDTKTSFINDKNNHKKNECEILICYDKYILKNESGKKLEENSKSIWWMGYKY